MNDRVEPDGTDRPDKTEMPQTPDTPDLITMGYGRPARRRLLNPAALAGVAIVALAGGAGAGYAATHSSGSHASDTAAAGVSGAAAAASTPIPSPSPSAPSAPSAPRWRGAPGGKHWFAFGGFMGALGPVAGGVVHGQVVVPKSGGGYQTVDLQRGQVTAVTSNSISVKSSDGYSASYTVTSSTVVDAKAAGIGSVKTGDTVIVTATVSGSAATAASIIDPTAIKAGRATFGFPEAPASAPANAPS